jgi:hypothetical protein
VSKRVRATRHGTPSTTTPVAWVPSTPSSGAGGRRTKRAMLCCRALVRACASEFVFSAGRTRARPLTPALACGTYFPTRRGPLHGAQSSLAQRRPPLAGCATRHWQSPRRATPAPTAPPTERIGVALGLELRGPQRARFATRAGAVLQRSISRAAGAHACRSPRCLACSTATPGLARRKDARLRCACHGHA